MIRPAFLSSLPTKQPLRGDDDLVQDGRLDLGVAALAVDHDLFDLFQVQQPIGNLPITHDGDLETQLGYFALTCCLIFKFGSQPLNDPDLGVHDLGDGRHRAALQNEVIVAKDIAEVCGDREISTLEALLRLETRPVAVYSATPNSTP